MSRLKDKMRLEFEAEGFPQRAPRNRDLLDWGWCDVGNNTTSHGGLVVLPACQSKLWSTCYRRSHIACEQSRYRGGPLARYVFDS